MEYEVSLFLYSLCLIRPDLTPLFYSGHSKPMRLNMIFNFFNKKPTTTTNTAASAPSKPKAAVKASSSTTTAPATTNSRYSVRRLSNPFTVI